MKVPESAQRKEFETFARNDSNAETFDAHEMESLGNDNAALKKGSKFANETGRLGPCN